MRILSIETSCDETAISIVDAMGGVTRPRFIVRSNIILSQAKLHAEYGGVFPALAKREHAKALTPLLEQSLKEAKLFHTKKSSAFTPALTKKLEAIFTHEQELSTAFLALIPSIKKPAVDAIAVTHGPGLEPALWVGVNFARALSLVWDIPLIPVNHMEGHIYGSLVEEKWNKLTLAPLSLPAVALLVSGGHTELVLIKKLRSYKLLGKTRDDAIGEAFDKVARMLGLPYPGGPAISKLAKEASHLEAFPLPRPMIKSGDLDFSFSGLKTSVLYAIKKLGHALTDEERLRIAKGFQDSVVEVIATKVAGAVRAHGARTVIAGGGVAANKQIRAALEAAAEQEGFVLRVPPLHLSTDNALMIAVAAYGKKPLKGAQVTRLRAQGNLTLT